MRKMVILILIFTGISFAQYEVTGAFGIGQVYMPGLADYINTLGTPDKVNSFHTAADFGGETSLELSEKWMMGLDYNYSMYNYNSSYAAAQNYSISYKLHKPSVILYYKIGSGVYYFKLGAGIGYRHISLTEKILEDKDYSSSGAGLIIRASALTALSENAFVNITGSIGGDIYGNLKSDGLILYDNAKKENVSASLLSFGIKLGITYKL